MNPHIYIPRMIPCLLIAICVSSAWSAGDPSSSQALAITVRNNSPVPMLQGRDEVVLPLVEIAKSLRLPHNILFSESQLDLQYRNKSIPFQIDRLGGVNGDELVFLLPTNLPARQNYTIRCIYSPEKDAPDSSEAASPLQLKQIAGFVRVEASKFSAVIDAETGGVNRLWLHQPSDKKILLTRSSRDNWAYTFIGNFASRNGGMAWKDRLISGQFRGRLTLAKAGPVRAVIVVDDIRFAANPSDVKHDGDVSFDDRLRMTHFVYADGRVIVRMNMSPGSHRGDSSYNLVCMHLGVGDAKRPPVESADGNLPFSRILVGDKSGRVVANRPIAWDQPGWAHDAKIYAPLSFLELAHLDKKHQYGVSMIVNPASYLLQDDGKPSDGAPAWWARTDVDARWGLVRTDYWYGSFFNLVMCTREWPKELIDPKTNVGLEVCYYVWSGRDDTPQVAQRLRNTLSSPGNLEIKPLP